MTSLRDSTYSVVWKAEEAVREAGEAVKAANTVFIESTLRLREFVDMTPQLTGKEPKLELLKDSVERARVALESERVALERERVALESARAYSLTLISNVKKQELELSGIIIVCSSPNAEN
jgi:hypothetical protein